jgi:hypothetical protein
MAKVRVLVITCDRHGGEIKNSEEYFHFDVTVGGKPGRKPHKAFDLCPACSAEFLKFLEGKTPKKFTAKDVDPSGHGLTANQRIAEGII